MRIAIVGLGFMGVTHLKALQASNTVRVGAVVSSDEKKLNGDFSGVGGNLDTTASAIDLSEVKKYRKLAELLKDPEIDAVDLCLPTHKHAPGAIEALQAGKHVLLEKPMALSGEECDKVIAAARQANKIVMCAQVLRFFPFYRRLIEDLPEMGRIRSARFRRRCAAPSWGEWLRVKSMSGGGVFDLLIHDVDMMLRVFGQPRGVKATGFEDLDGGIDLISAHFDYAGFTCEVSGGWHPGKYPFGMEYTVVTQKGTIDYRLGEGDPKVYPASGKDPETWVTPEGVDGYRDQIEYFAHCAAKGHQPDLCSPIDSANAVRWTKRMEEARRG